jgi:hypothetical protein
MRRTLAISANLSLYPCHNLTHSFPNVLSSGYSLNNSSAGSGEAQKKKWFKTAGEGVGEKVSFGAAV